MRQNKAGDRGSLVAPIMPESPFAGAIAPIPKSGRFGRAAERETANGVPPFSHLAKGEFGSLKGGDDDRSATANDGMERAVAMTYQDPAASKRRLLRELRRYRAQAQLTQKDVALALDWSASKVVRIESGTVALTTTDLRALLQTYRVDDADAVHDLTALAKDAKRQSSWADFRDVAGQPATTYFGYEESASILRQFEPLLIPGLLQTEEYARALLRDVFARSAQAIERLVQARIRRQELLDRERPPEMFFILGEAAVRQAVGGPGVMRRQLERLAELGAEKNISIQIMGFDLGAHPGLQGPFILLEFPDPSDDNVLYLESRVDVVTRDDTDETAMFLDTFLDMEGRASRADKLSSVLFPAG